MLPLERALARRPQELPQSFTQGLSVANYADSGESSGSFLTDSRLFPTMRPLIADGDAVLIPFGHNDKQTSAEDFRANLTGLIDGVRDQGGTPVLVTPIVRRWFNDDGTLNNGTAIGSVLSCDHGWVSRCRIQRMPAHNSSPAM